MYVQESSLEKQVFVGPFLGPFLALLTMATALFYYSPQQMELPLAGLAGIYCSWKWRLRGAAIAWVFLGAVTAFKSLSSIEPSVWWNITLATSIGLACLVTALTQRNVRDHLEWKYQDSVEQQSRLAIVEARLNTILQTVQQERAEAQAQIETLQEQLSAKANNDEDYARFMDTARSELNQTRTENELLNTELTNARQQAISFSDDLQQAKEALWERQKQEDNFVKQENELKELRHMLDAYQHQIVSYKDDLQRARQQQTMITEMSELLDTLTREKSLLENTIKSLQTELENRPQAAQTSDDIAVDENSPSELRRLEGFYRQLREQFEDKSNVLDETRKELFHTQEKLKAAELENSERELSVPQIPLEEHIKHLAAVEDELKQELEHSHQEIKRLYQLVDSIVTAPK